MDLDEQKIVKGGFITLLTIVGIIFGILADWKAIFGGKETPPVDNSSSVVDTIDSEDDYDSIEDNEDSGEDAIAPPPDYQPKMVKLSDLDFFNTLVSCSYRGYFYPVNSLEHHFPKN